MMLREIAPVTVHVRREEVAALAAALDFGATADLLEVPWIYPAIWLAHPAVRQALLASLEKGEIPLHEAQEFSYAAEELTAETRLVMSGDIRRELSGERVRILIHLHFMKEAAEIARLSCRLIAIRAGAGAT
jgi:hypothetical protein